MPGTEMGMLALSEVPVASFCGKPATSTRPGTMTMPPPTPNSPEVNPARTPTTAIRNQCRSVGAASPGRVPGRPRLRGTSGDAVAVGGDVVGLERGRPGPHADGRSAARPTPTPTPHVSAPHTPYPRRNTQRLR